MNHVLTSTVTTNIRTWTNQKLLWRMLFIAIFSSYIAAAYAKEIQQKGDACSQKNRLPSSLVCVEGFVVDCRNSSDSLELLYCAAGELQKTDAELNRLYQSILKKMMKPNDEDADYKAAQKSFIEAQRAWLKFKKSDCEVSGYLNLKGSIQSNEIVNCELRHTKNRVSDLGFYLNSLK
ncbi:MAG: lysozyme inhibitor LprI family protein [Pseudomonadota bacterium]